MQTVRLVVSTDSRAARENETVRSQPIHEAARLRPHWRARGQDRECIYHKRPTQRYVPNFCAPAVSVCVRLVLEGCDRETT